MAADSVTLRLSAREAYLLDKLLGLEFSAGGLADAGPGEWWEHDEADALADVHERLLKAKQRVARKAAAE